VFNTTFNNISAISWRSVLLVEEAGVPGENHRPAAKSHCQTLSHIVIHLAHNLFPFLCLVQATYLVYFFMFCSSFHTLFTFYALFKFTYLVYFLCFVSVYIPCLLVMFCSSLYTLFTCYVLFKFTFLVYFLCFVSVYIPCLLFMFCSS
jgi:hypothetical protein